MEKNSSGIDQSPLGSDRFVREILKELNGKGDSPPKSIVFFVGAGFSASSGLPTAADLRDYLSLCISKALGINEKGEFDGKFWHPTKKSWPHLESKWRQQANAGLKAIVENSDLLIPALSTTTSSTANPVSPGDREIKSYLELCNQARGALIDWRTALQFLASLAFEEIVDPEPVDPEHETAVSNAKPSVPNKVTGESKNTAIKKDAIIYAYRKRNGNIYSTSVDTHVVDSFFTTITSGKRPSVNHVMLAQLASVTRSRLVLTLNFDNLLDQAFLLNDMGTAVIDVHQRANLPRWSVFSDKYNILKLHGSNYGLRADLSLDEEPSREDHYSFQSYFLQNTELHSRGTDSQASQVRKKTKAVLFVTGFSAGDRRIRLLIFDALRELKDLRVFWVCHRDADRLKIKEAIDKATSQGGEWASRLLIDRNMHVGLLLSQLYYEYTGTFPHAGMQLPTLWRLPLQPAPPSEVKQGDVDDKLLRKFGKILSNQKGQGRKWGQNGGVRKNKKNQSSTISVNLHEKSAGQSDSIELRYGITDRAWNLYSQYFENRKAVWLNLKDSKDLDHFVRRVASAVQAQYQSNSSLPQIPLRVLLPNSDSTIKCKVGSPEYSNAIDTQIDEVVETILHTAQDWLFVLDTRTLPGYDADLFRKFFQPRKRNDNSSKTPTTFSAYLKKRAVHWESGWKVEKNSSAEIQTYRILQRIGEKVHQSSNLNRLGILVLSRAPLEQEGLEKISSDPICVGKEKKDWLEERIRTIENWLKTEKNPNFKMAKIRMLRQAILFRNGRHPSAFANAEIFDHNINEFKHSSVDQRVAETNFWVDELVKLGVLRRLPGGYIWMPAKMRERIRFWFLENARIQKIVNDSCSDSNDSVSKDEYDFTNPRFLSDLHTAVADWYQVFFYSGGDSYAAIESIFHRCRSAQLKLSLFDDKDKFHAELQRVVRDLSESSQLLKIAKDSTLFEVDYQDCLDAIDGFARILETTQEGIKEIGLSSEPLVEVSRERILELREQNSLLSIEISRDVGDVAEVSQRIVDALELDLDDLLLKISLEAGILCVTSRCYSVAREVFERTLIEYYAGGAIIEYVTKSEMELEDESKRWYQDFVLWASKNENATDYESLIRLLRRLMESYVLLAEFDDDQSETRNQAVENESKPLTNWDIAQRIYWVATEISRYTTGVKESEFRKERVRICSLAAAVAANRGTGDGAQERRRLNEALAIVAGVGTRDEVVARTIIELRTIYCVLCRLRRNPAVKLVREGAAVFFKFNARNRIAGCEDVDVASLQTGLDAAEHSLNELEEMLAKGQRNLWWWSTFVRYSAEVAEIRLIVGLIQFWKDQDRQVSTVNDYRWLDLSWDRLARRIQHDPFQMSRVSMITFRSIAIREALEEIKPGDSSDEVATRIEKMLNQIREALARWKRFTCHKRNSKGVWAVIQRLEDKKALGSSGARLKKVLARDVVSINGYVGSVIDYGKRAQRRLSMRSTAKSSTRGE
jgi:hypothetical protein